MMLGVVYMGHMKATNRHRHYGRQKEVVSGFDVGKDRQNNDVWERTTTGDTTQCQRIKGREGNLGSKTDK